MLVRSHHLDGLIHGFSTREGGVSEGRYASLNLGGKWGDDPDAVRQNRQRVAALAGFDLAQLRIAKQVHGNVVVNADTLDAATLAATEADAVIASEPGLVPAVLTADCIPILISDARSRGSPRRRCAPWRRSAAIRRR
jgi:copper oxidase (laccase) domain-containing protein